MAHAVFQTAQIMPINTQIIPHKYKPRLPFSFHPACLKLRKCPVRIRGSLSSPPVLADGYSVGQLERCLVASTPSESTCSPSNSSLAADVAAGVRSASKRNAPHLSSLAVVTLEKPKTFEMTQQTQKKSSPELSTGGGGGDIGKKIFHGGGDGGDDGGDDDDYFDDFDEDDDGDDGGLFRRRIPLQELFDHEFVDAVMNEWMKTMMDLPAGFRQAYEMGLVSSAQMVKLLSINARPTTARAISRSLPQSISRAFIGRLIADPAFLYKLLLEQATTIGCSVWWELKNRRERIKQEWDLALINVLTVSACNAIIVWSLAPCRSYGNTFKFNLQNTLQKLPNNIFENSYHLREFDLQKRIHSFFYKAAELCLVGMTSGVAQGALSNLCASKKEQRVSVIIPSVSTNALGYGAFLGIYANLRYQLLCGVDTVVTNYFDVIGVALFFNTALRVLNVQLGEASRLAWLGVESDPLASDNLLKAYERPSEADSKQSSGNWSISKNGLGLLGFKQGTREEQNAPKPRRKKIVRRKVTTSA